MDKRAVEMMGKCPMRRPQSCGLVDVQLGFVLGVDETICQGCYEAGPGSEQSLKARTAMVQLTVDQMKPRWPRIAHPGLRALVGGAMTDEERQAAQQRVEQPPQQVKRYRWWGVLWDGLPYPWLLARAAWRGLKVGATEIKRVGWPWSKRESGCGCLSTPKRLFSRLARRPANNTLSGGSAK